MSATPARSGARGDSRVRVRALAVVGAVLADALIWLVAHGLFDLDLRVPDGPGSTSTSELPFPVVVVSVAVVSLLGWGLLALLERFAPGRARTTWTVLAVAVLVLSLFAPLFSEGLSAGNRITLVLLHLTVGAFLVPAFRRGSGPQ
ncbi:DUF6069 family protein [Streptomyces sp. Amel2xC10]|uniref:DUF6069 family protein n=1 Tax=Streptomyces sp. Amel2xC10 TaxID=1305826 RepID=UPI000A083961|nr:DUF6069 family protein [Streptomyces sp. Amel2xC10]SMF57327.1 hypothetical protein SAMN02745830_04494 [Streptomyces sp. Amel2xC10]